METQFYIDIFVNSGSLSYRVRHSFSDCTFVIAAVNVVFPWSTCPIVPTFTCGFVRSNFALAMALFLRSKWLSPNEPVMYGLAHSRGSVRPPPSLFPKRAHARASTKL